MRGGAASHPTLRLHRRQQELPRAGAGRRRNTLRRTEGPGARDSAPGLVTSGGPPGRSAPLRLRHVLLLAVLGGALLYAYPRARAAWRLHALATELADYARCMVGPTGPALLRDNPAEFRRLARRRLVAAGAGDRPFRHCAKAAAALTGSDAVERAHLAAAWTFVEYGAGAMGAEGGEPQHAIGDLAVTTLPLAELAEAAWPFVRGGYTSLVRPSLHAREAPHPVEPARASAGQGLPSWRAQYRSVRRTRSGLLLAHGQGANLAALESRDGGLTWAPVSPRRVASVAGRCVAGDRGHAFTFGTSTDGRLRTVRTIDGSGRVLHTAPLTPSENQVFAAACDATALAVAVGRQGSRKATLHLCPLESRCTPVSLPRLEGVDVEVLYPFDVARIEGTTVLAVEMQGIARVASSRDGGQTWTPLTVAYDPAEQSSFGAAVRAPGRLLALERQVLLYGGSDRPGESYPVLISDDLGASFRAM